MEARQDFAGVDTRTDNLGQLLACGHADSPLLGHLMPPGRTIRRVANYMRQRGISGNKTDESMRIWLAPACSA